MPIAHLSNLLKRLSGVTAKGDPIGIDFGTETLRLAQTHTTAEGIRLIAAAEAAVPAEIRHDAGARAAFFTRTVSKLLAEHPFHGRSVALALPASWTCIEHVRTARLDDRELRAALPFETAERFPFHASAGVLRHVVAGDVYVGGEAKQEVIVLGTPRERVERLLDAAHRARLDVVGLETEARTIVAGYARAYRRRVDGEATVMFVDLGVDATRVIIARDGRLRFARVIPTGLGRTAGGTEGDEGRSTSGRPPSEAPASRIADDRERRASSQTLSGATAPDAPPPQAAGDATLARLGDELALCRRYHETTFPEVPVTKVLFVGGGAGRVAACQRLARAIGVTAAVGDPFVRMRPAVVGARAEFADPCPHWFVAMSLTLAAAAETKRAAA